MLIANERFFLHYVILYEEVLNDIRATPSSTGLIISAPINTTAIFVSCFSTLCYLRSLNDITIHCLLSFLSHGYNLRQRFVSRSNNSQEIRSTDYGEMDSARRINSNFVLHPTCKKMEYMQHVEPKRGKSLLLTIWRGHGSYCRPTVPSHDRKRDCFI